MSGTNGNGNGSNGVGSPEFVVASTAELRARAIEEGKLSVLEVIRLATDMVKDRKEDMRWRVWGAEFLADRVLGLPRVSKSEGEVVHKVDADAIAAAVERYVDSQGSRQLGSGNGAAH